MLYRRKPAKNKILIFLLSVFILLAVLILILNAAINQHYDSVAKSRGKKLCAEAIEQCVNKIVCETKDKRLIDITYNEAGKITSIETDTSSINSIQSSLADMINKELDSKNSINDKIPVGTLTGNAFFIGKGPSVSLDFTQNNSAQVMLVSEFSSAGINQSIHQIYAHITIDAYCFSLFRNASFTYDFDYLVCETIIVGEIPQRYLSLG